MSCQETYPKPSFILKAQTCQKQRLILKAGNRNVKMFKGIKLHKIVVNRTFQKNKINSLRRNLIDGLTLLL